MNQLNQPPRILRIADSYTAHTATLRLDAGDDDLTLGQLLEKYLFHLPRERLLNCRAITPQSLTALQTLQDLVYACDDRGRLAGIYSGLAFRQGEAGLELSDVPAAQLTNAGENSASLIEITIDRTDAGYDRNWAGFHRRRWANEPEFFSDFVQTTMETALGASDGRAVMERDTTESRLKFLKVLARRIWDSEFENYSRFVGPKLMFKTGDETVRNIAAGAGGICTEKVQALKFLTDHYGLESEYLIGGPDSDGPLPASRLRELLQTFDFRFAKRYMRYWQHAALLYHLDGVPVLVDATNGNIPFMFLAGPLAERLLADAADKQSVPVRMVEAEENYYYHRTPQDIPLNLFFALEGWLTDTDMVQVFENELGLYLSRGYYVAPLPYRTEQEYQRLAADYYAIARRAGFRYQASAEWNLDTDLGREFCGVNPTAAAGILAAKEHLLLRYNEWDVPGHDAGLLVMRLSQPTGKARQ